MPILVVDTETGGLNPNYHEILQIALVWAKPDFRFDNTRLPFKMLMKPNHPERVESGALAVNGLSLDYLDKHGVSQEKGAEIFYAWWKKECKGEQIEPVGQNWPFDRSFMMSWLGASHFNEIFHRHYRDTCSAAKFINDRQKMVDGKEVFKYFRLEALCNALGVKYEKGHDAYQDCVMTLEVYRQLLLKPILQVILQR